jgi:hypothetical protein
VGPALEQNASGVKWFAFVRDEESEEDEAKVRIVSLGTDGTTVIDSIKPGQGKLPIPKCAPATANDFCSDALWVVPATGPGSALADGTNALKGVPGGKIRIEYYAPDAGTTPTCTATVDVVKTDLEIYKPRVIDWSESMIPDGDEEAVGSATFVNLDNDDGDGMFDCNPDGGVNDPAVPNDDELLRVKLRVQPKDLPSGTVKLVATAGGADIQVWKQNNKQAGSAYNLGDALTVPGDFSEEGDALVKEMWVEGISPHAAPRATALEMGLELAGQDLGGDEVALTIIGIESVTWVGRGNSLNDDDNLTDDPN